MKALLLALTLSLLGGCMNICYLAQTREPCRDSWPVYEPTRGCCQCIRAGALAWCGQQTSLDGVGEAYTAIFLPFLVIDLPCEVVLDTVFLPWDIGWEIVRQNGSNQ